jgi:hypothetical protein
VIIAGFSSLPFYAIVFPILYFVLFLSYDWGVCISWTFKVQNDKLSVIAKALSLFFIEVYFT